jgi:excisionase family DNA binding protein
VSANPTKLPERQTYTVAEAAALLGVPRSTLYEAIGRGEVAHVRISRRIVVPKWWVDGKLKPPGGGG